MLEKIMSNGFNALAGYVYILTVITFVFYFIAMAVNAYKGDSLFKTDEIRKIFVTTLSFSAAFALLGYFLVK